MRTNNAPLSPGGGQYVESASVDGKERKQEALKGSGSGDHGVTGGPRPPTMEVGDWEGGVAVQG